MTSPHQATRFAAQWLFYFQITSLVGNVCVGKKLTMLQEGAAFIGPTLDPCGRGNNGILSSVDHWYRQAIDLYRTREQLLSRAVQLGAARLPVRFISMG